MEENKATKTPPILWELPEEMLGERVLARPYRPGDGAALWEAVEESRTHILAWLPWPDTHKTPADSEAWARRACARWLLREDLNISLWDRATGRFLGGCGLHIRSLDVPCFEIGYWLRASAVGQGYMTDAARLLCRLAFERLSANRVLIQCDARNARSAAIPLRLGFVREAALRNDFRDASGALRDTLIFAMTPGDYERSGMREEA
jgi:RimJ/RimL family protein N-acetyltransferase